MAQLDNQKIIILETDQGRRDVLRSMVSGWGYTAFLFGRESSCLDNITPLAPDLVLSGLLPAERAYRFIHTVKNSNYGLPMVFMSDDRALLDFIDTNGFDDVAVVDHASEPSEIQRAVESALSKCCTAGRDNRKYPLIIGNSGGIAKIRKMIPGLNLLMEPILIQGEAGTGKELVARSIHCKSKRWDKPFIKIDANRIPNEWLEADHREHPPGDGSPGAQRFSDVFYAADSGTLFFKEIAALPMTLQLKLLDFFVESGVLVPSRKSVDIRVIASTCYPLDQRVEEGKFRKELYFRLNGTTIQIPPLRRRREDIPLLADFFADQCCIEIGRSHIELPENTKNIFYQYYWPGNVDELNQLVRTVILEGKEATVIEKMNLINSDRENSGYEIEDVCAAEIAKLRIQMEKNGSCALKEVGRSYLSRIEKKIMEKALEISKGNRRRAAEMLDISYKSLLNKIKEYKLN